MHCSLHLIVQTLVFSRSYLHRQVSPPETCGGHRRIIFVFLHVEVGSREIKMVDKINLCLCAREGF